MPVDVKITNLPAADTINTNDLFLIVDVSNAPTTKKIQAYFLAALAPVQTVAGKTGSVVLNIYDVDGLSPALTAKQDAGSYATLVDGVVPLAQLPSFGAALLQYATLASFPGTGETGKLYVAIDTGQPYRWGGSEYVAVNAFPGSTDVIVEGTTNLYFTSARAIAAAPVQSVAGRTGNVTVTKSDVGLSDCDNTSDSDKPISAATQIALNEKAPYETTVLALGSVNGPRSISYAADRQMQTLTLTGASTTFLKGTGWPGAGISVDVLLEITVTSATTITWSIVNDWYAQPPAGALTTGKHLILLRAVGTTMQGHYVGSKTN
jgi:hypothetical protein